MKTPPFYANTDDNMHCTSAVYRSVLEYFLDKKMTWPELDAFTGFTAGKIAWSTKALVQMARMGFDIRMVEAFDYAEYAKNGQPYLETYMPQQQLAWQLAHTNILDIQPLIPQFLETVHYIKQHPTLDDIDSMLDEGRLVFVTLNSGLLNDSGNYADHALLVFGREDGYYIAHDPGLPPQPGRRITRELLWRAMGGKKNTAEVTGFKLKARHNMRLDHYVVGQHPELSRSYATKLIDEGKVTVNGSTSKAGYKLRERDEVSIDYDASVLENIPDIALPIIYEDDDVVVINKPAGVLTHNVGNRNLEATVASFLRSHAGLAADGSSQRTGIVHRLDRLTSGVMICAKHPQALSWLQKQFHDRTVQKTYAAVIKGRLSPVAAIIDMPIERNPKAPATFRVGANGKNAQTAYETVATGKVYSLLELRPKTGRTHQLRVHLAHQGHPIAGDSMYDGPKADRLYLHAHFLEITLPNGKTERFEAPLPAEFNTKVGAAA